ncbi:MAG: hypothetical protein ACO1RT_12835 [Planctomycetaceae bacterium]
MQNKRLKTARKRVALAMLVALVSQASSPNAHAELVEASISDASHVVTAQALSPQDPNAAPPAPAAQATPSVPGTPSAPASPGDGSAATPDQPDAPPTISEPFADPLANQTPGAFPPPTAPSPNLGAGAAGLGLSSSLGVTAGSASFAPTMMGDLFGGGVSIIGASQETTRSFFSQGTIISGSGNSAVLAFDFGSGTPNDIFTDAGTGVDTSGDGQVDQFDILEPLPPTDAPTSPGPGFVYQAGQAVFTGSNTSSAPANGAFTDGDFWFIKYSYVSDVFANGSEGIVIAGPDSATRRTKLSENFSPDLRDRVFFNYNFFNDAFGGLGDVSRYVLGLERIVFDDVMSVEVRLPMAGTLTSHQQADSPGDRSFELGNMTLVGKFLLLKSDDLTWTAGSGVTAPLADDARLMRGDNELLRIENEGIHFLPFMGLLKRFDRRTYFQAYTQFDFDANGNPVAVNLGGGPLQDIGTFSDSALAHVDLSGHRVIYQNRRPSSILKALIANAELHYTGTLQESDVVSGGGVTVANLKGNFNIVNATFGAHLLLGKNLVVTPGMAVPLRDGLDEQFDYEALLQMNYYR